MTGSADVGPGDKWWPRRFANRFGLLGLWLAVVIYWHHENEHLTGGDDRTAWVNVSDWLGLEPAGPVFVEYFLSITLIGVVLGGVSGLLSYNAFKPHHHKNHAGAAVLVWSLGVLLLCVTAYLATLLVQASACMTFNTEKNVWMVIATIPEGSDCNATVARLYPALQPFQTGIGATIGLLGLAWSTMYRSVYEDWLHHAAPAAPDAAIAPSELEKRIDALLQTSGVDTTKMKLDALLKSEGIDPTKLK